MVKSRAACGVCFGIDNGLRRLEESDTPFNPEIVCKSGGLDKPQSLVDEEALDRFAIRTAEAHGTDQVVARNLAMALGFWGLQGLRDVRL